MNVTCAHCGQHIDAEYKFCISCTDNLKVQGKCLQCGINYSCKNNSSYHLTNVCGDACQKALMTRQSQNYRNKQDKIYQLRSKLQNAINDKKDVEHELRDLQHDYDRLEDRYDRLKSDNKKLTEDNKRLAEEKKLLSSKKREREEGEYSGVCNDRNDRNDRTNTTYSIPHELIPHELIPRAEHNNRVEYYPMPIQYYHQYYPVMSSVYEQPPAQPASSGALSNLLAQLKKQAVYKGQ